MDDMTPTLARFLLAGSRFAPLLLVKAASPLAWVPLYVRLTLLLIASLFAVGIVVPVQAGIPGLDQPVALLVVLLGEFVFGFGLALAVILPAAAVGFSARVIDVQSGVSAMTILNPSNPSAEAMAGTAMQWVVTLIFFALGFHLLLLNGFYASMKLVPLGAAGMSVTPTLFLSLLGRQFLLGLSVSAPVILGLFAVDAAVAFVSRSMPQANIYFLALPLKVAAAFLLLAIVLKFAPQWIGRMFGDAFTTLGLDARP
ncbi:hypothetical protein GCM10027285_26710 [Oleiagrimonas citrea]|uniref:Flagellar biosynthetic protein FliR n=1 Tax=Oleiagrimonas citrea TaxID=1665687 RepID=A0A846ZNG9_9GAMM|nr:flagellar biosynthetic protein FliR [Oleiagrimonas citrea]NKZ39011.1 flagellar biosynthetic protein FliR [Oleiagrimonas citrea]